MCCESQAEGGTPEGRAGFSLEELDAAKRGKFAALEETVKILGGKSTEQIFTGWVKQCCGNEDRRVALPRRAPQAADLARTPHCFRRQADGDVQAAGEEIKALVFAIEAGGKR